MLLAMVSCKDSDVREGPEACDFRNPQRRCLEEPVLSNAYICAFKDLQIQSVLIDEVPLDPCFSTLYSRLRQWHV